MFKSTSRKVIEGLIKAEEEVKTEKYNRSDFWRYHLLIQTISCDFTHRKQ